MVIKHTSSAWSDDSIQEVCNRHHVFSGVGSDYVFNLVARERFSILLIDRFKAYPTLSVRK
jgi:hypothetical protein